MKNVVVTTFFIWQLSFLPFHGEELEQTLLTLKLIDCLHLVDRSSNTLTAKLWLLKCFPASQKKSMGLHAGCMFEISALNQVNGESLNDYEEQQDHNNRWNRSRFPRERERGQKVNENKIVYRRSLGPIRGIKSIHFWEV